VACEKLGDDRVAPCPQVAASAHIARHAAATRAGGDGGGEGGDLNDQLIGEIDER